MDGDIRNITKQDLIMMLKTPIFLKLLCAVLISFTFQSINAQEWPNKPIRIIVPLPPERVTRSKPTLPQPTLKVGKPAEKSGFSAHIVGRCNFSIRLNSN
jgi:hypothetical protein